MKTVTYKAQTPQGSAEIVIPQHQQILVIRALQRMYAHDVLKTALPLPLNIIELIRKEINQFFAYGWVEDQFYPGSRGEFWLSDRAIKAILKSVEEEK